nr:unnamed protein product [Digitaria exilis]
MQPIPTTGALSTLHKHDPEKLAVEVEVVAGGEHTEATTLAAIVSDDIIPIALATILDVMDSDDNGEFPMPAITASTIITEHVQVVVPIFVAVPTLDTDPSDTNMKVHANDLMRFLDSNIKIYVPMDGQDTVLIPTTFDRPALRLLLPSFHWVANNALPQPPPPHEPIATMMRYRPQTPSPHEPACRSLPPPYSTQKHRRHASSPELQQLRTGRFCSHASLRSK